MGLRYRYGNDPLLIAYRDAVQKKLGGPPESKWPEPLAGAMRTLTSPFSALHFGVMCYDGGDPPPGRKETDALVKAGRPDLLGQVLRDANPEARVYAAQALLALKSRGQTVSKSDLEAIRILRGMKNPIECCAGCEVYDQPADKALDDKSLSPN